MKTVAYLRVSTPQQDVSSQRLAILEYAQKHDLHIDDFIEATASGQASEKRRRLDELTSALQPGDRLVVSELSRLGRSLGQIVAILDALAKAGGAFVALKENIRVEGKRDIQTKVTTTLFALFAEVERNLISERTREGLAKARASGRKLGRPKGSLGVSLPHHPLQLHDHQKAQAEPLACITTRMLSVPLLLPRFHGVRPARRLLASIRRIGDLEQAAQAYAVADVVPEHLAEIRAARIALIDKTEAAVKDRLTKEISYWDHRAAQLALEEGAGKTGARLNSGEARRRADTLQRRLQKRLEKLKRDAQTVPPCLFRRAGHRWLFNTERSTASCQADVCEACGMLRIMSFRQGPHRLLVPDGLAWACGRHF